MRFVLLAIGWGALTVCSAHAQTTPATKPTTKPLLAVVTNSRAEAEVVARSNRLTDKMARQLQLNHYQTARLRTLNQDRARRMYAIERTPDLDPRAADEQCQGICREQERELRQLLSTTQYTDYYEARNDFYTFDKQFLAQARDETRRPDEDRPAALPNAAPELKETTAPPVLRQGK
jgi:hypothetical protein